MKKLNRRTRRWLAMARQLHREHKGLQPVHYYLHQTKRMFRRGRDVQ